MKEIFEKLKKSKLAGRSGSAFPVYLKWQQVVKAKADKKFIICNGAEGEPNVFKDTFILENYAEEVIEGMKIALKTIDKSSAFLYLRKDSYKKFKAKLEKIIGRAKIVLVEKKGGYIAGEETAVCEVIERKKARPKLKPPFVGEKGLFGCPTLVNNVETFYWVAKIAKREYKNERFYSISGDVKKKGVFLFPEDWSVKKILEESNNFPDFDFFVKIGGGVCGRILLPEELNEKMCGAGALVVFNRGKTDLLALMQEWAEFLHNGNCDKCTPCREGIYRILENLKTKKLDKEILEDLFFVLDQTSFCSLGKAVPDVFEQIINKLNGF